MMPSLSANVSSSASGRSDANQTAENSVANKYGSSGVRGIVLNTGKNSGTNAQSEEADGGFFGLKTKHLALLGAIGLGALFLWRRR